MKSVTIHIEKGELNRLLKEMTPGDAVILTDGDREIMLESAGSLNLDEDSEDLGNEILKALKTPLSNYSQTDLAEIIRRVRSEPSQR